MGQSCCRTRTSFDSTDLGEQHSLITGRNRRPVRSSVSPDRCCVDAAQCRVEWNTSGVVSVGGTTVATVHFFSNNGHPYKLQLSDVFHCSIVHIQSRRTVRYVLEPSNTVTNCGVVSVSFITHLVGGYQVHLTINGHSVGRGVYTRTYCPAPPDPKKTMFYNYSDHFHVKCNEYNYLTLALRDSFENMTKTKPDLLKMKINKNGIGGPLVETDCLTTPVEDINGRYEILYKLKEPGYYVGRVLYNNQPLGSNNMEIFCLSDDSAVQLEDNLEHKYLVIGYDSLLVHGKRNHKKKKVKCFISPRKFQVREYSLFQLISTRLFTCRVCNATKLHMEEESGRFIVDDGSQNPITLISPSREVIAAIFYTFVQRNIGGTERFQDKRHFFQKQLLKGFPTVEDSLRMQVRLKISRFNILESMMEATKGLKIEGWRKRFYTVFDGESGIDVGGVTRELFGCLCDILFGAQSNNSLFMRFSESPQSLTHPTPRRMRDPLLKLEHYEFAGRIVGKCLYESALGNSLYVKAHFTRSFLAQVIGVRVTWKHFETDDPDLYRYKVQQLRDQSVDDLELSLKFVEEQYDNKHTSNPKVVPLVSGGEKLRVTDENKLTYLNSLAQHRLVSQVTDEIQAFVKGLHDFIPDELLSIFDEHELELLMCGMKEISFADLRQHTQVRGHTQSFLRSVEWFWAVVKGFSQEEMARLVQFVTGSSQLPPGGFKELRPPFLIAASGDAPNRLPYAHTCFNHICLPEYHSFEQFHRSLMTAINEGCEGILLQ